MSISQILFSFQGRLNRKPWWLTNLVMALIAVVLVIVAAVMAGGAFLSEDPVAILTALGGLLIVFLILLIPIIWIWLALGAKRLHDRNKSAWWLLVFYVLPNVLNVIGAQLGDVATIIVSLAAFAISIWGLVEMGFLRGTVGPNQYGPDPLEGRI